jgi:hypothetical protein
MANTVSSNYWTATAQEVALATVKYVYDICGVKCRVNPEDETKCTICEPWCTSCGYPPHICDSYWTKCTGTKIGRWFNEEEDRWIEAEPDKTPEQEEKKEEKARWSQHKFGLCPGCKVGLDDRADFRCSYVNGTDNGIIMCWDCYEKENSNQQVCTNCFHPVNEGDVIIGSLHPMSRQRVVTFCRRC